ncbi:hypothetical protein [Pantoea ananatis]|uniref:hypothetical protein n=1 Tax=Pantoea ananas TaxID=553 RepID=UPI0023B19E67|nr:hypothetical protein [Pantoea ananatis]
MSEFVIAEILNFNTTSTPTPGIPSSYFITFEPNSAGGARVFDSLENAKKYITNEMFKKLIELNEISISLRKITFHYHNAPPKLEASNQFTIEFEKSHNSTHYDLAPFLNSVLEKHEVKINLEKNNNGKADKHKINIDH